MCPWVAHWAHSTDGKTYPTAVLKTLPVGVVIWRGVCLEGEWHLVGGSYVRVQCVRLDRGLCVVVNGHP